MHRKIFSLAFAGCITLLAAAAPTMAAAASFLEHRWPDFIDADTRLHLEAQLRALDIEPCPVATASQVRVYQLRRVARTADDRLALAPDSLGSDLSI